MKIQKKTRKVAKPRVKLVLKKKATKELIKEKLANLRYERRSMTPLEISKRIYASRLRTVSPEESRKTAKMSAASAKKMSRRSRRRSTTPLEISPKIYVPRQRTVSPESRPVLETSGAKKAPPRRSKTSLETGSQESRPVEQSASSSSAKAVSAGESRSQLGLSEVAEEAVEISPISAPAPQNRRKKVEPKKLQPKKKPKTSKVASEIQYYQWSTEELLPDAPFFRLVREITGQLDNSDSIKYRIDALKALKQATEAYMVGFLEDSYLLAGHAKRVTLMPRDLILAIRMKENM